MTPYPAARAEIRSGDLLAFRNRTWLGWLISHVTGGTYWHCGVAWVFRGRVFVLEATRAGVGLRALSAAVPCDWVQTCASWTEGAEEAALDRLGLPYSMEDALALGLGLPLSGGGEVCSAYAAEILRSCSVPVCAEQTPQELVNQLLDQGCTLRHLT